MSERKVLNKYYPPDFDPSKVPKSKVKRNATFEIRLMAPCNMRCTTCGEYIYKGRKFNARKEDVDDMNYLGLRIYRFYIKCTACVSEICFRTDPASTDYIIEAGATRNFEALRKAEEIAEKEDQARKEELENNPMKLLEERTAASKNEMEIAESLDELRELNRRTVAIDYDSIFAKFEQERQTAAEDEEKKDEEFVKSIFSKVDTGEKIKRLQDDSDEDEEDSKVNRKVAKLDNATDHLVEKKPAAEKAVWEKSIGTLSNRKGGLGILVKKKTPAVPTSSIPTVKTSTPSPSTNNLPQKPSLATTTSAPCKPSSGSNALGLLGNYSGSSSDSE